MSRTLIHTTLATKLKRSVIVGALLLGTVVPLAGTASPAAANNAKSAVCGAIESDAGCTKVTQGSSVNTVITAIVNILSLVVGVVAVIMIIVGGLRYITSSGDSNKIAAAKNTIIFAIVGLVIVALAQSIVHFVLSKL